MQQDHEQPLHYSTQDLNALIRDTLCCVSFAYCLVSSPNFRFIFFNSRFEQLLKDLDVRDPSSAIGKHAWDITPDLWEMMEPVYVEAAENGKPVESKRLSVLSNGRELVLDVAVVPILDEAGAPHAFAATFYDVTKESQEAAYLLESAELYKCIVETSCEGVWVLAADGKTTFVNERMARMLGYSAEEMRGRSFLDFIDEENYDTANEYWRHRVSGISEQHDFRFTRRDGTDLWTIIDTDPVFDEDGEFAGTFAMVTDITERKKTEEALYASEERFRTLVELAPNGIYMTDADGQCIYVNKRWCEMAGMSPEEAMGESWAAGLHPDDRERIHSKWQEMVKSRGSWELEYRFMTPEGKVTWVIGTATPLHDPSENIIGYLGLNTDITLRKKAEEKNSLLATFVENSSDFIGFTGMDQYPIYLNKAGQKMIGIESEEELHRITILDCFFEGDVEFVKNTVLPAVRRDGRWVGEIRFRHFKTGEAVDVIWDVFMLHHPQTGEPYGYATVTKDITERKRTERALKASESKYRQLYETLTDAFVSINMEGRLVEFNDAFRTMLGYEFDELQQLTYKDITPEKWWTIEDEIVEHQVLKAGHSEIYEKEYRRKDGTIFPVELRTLLLKDEDGEPKGMWGIVRDISERVQARKMNDALNYINTAISSTLDYEVILQRVVRDATEAIGTDSGFIVERHNAMWLHKYTYNFPYDIVGLELSDDDAGYSHIVAASKEMLVVNNALAPDAPKSRAAEMFGSRSSIVIPLLVRYEVIGALHFCYLHETRTFTSNQIDFARKLATAISLALENARLYEAQMQAVEGEARAKESLQHQFSTLQAALLPVLHRLEEPGYEFGARYIAAAPGQEIGGDFYDVFRTERGLIGILVGDVSGKDIEAASLAADTRSTVRAFSYDMQSAAAALEHTNAVLCARRTPHELFVTIFLALLEPQSGKISYASAGHPPPAVCRKAGDVEFVQMGSLPVGFRENVKYMDFSRQLKEGDKLVMYTDGVSEAHKGRDIFDQVGIERTLAGMPNATAQETADLLIDAARDWAGGKLSDDVAVVVLARTL